MKGEATREALKLLARPIRKAIPCSATLEQAQRVERAMQAGLAAALYRLANASSPACAFELRLWADAVAVPS